MAQAKSNKLYRTFTKGLITEASYLTYPEDSSLDELNTVPTRKGNRFRRLGINYNVSNISYRPTYSDMAAKAEFVWRAVASTPELTFLVVQNGSNLSWFDRSKPDFAANKKSFEVDLNAYTRPGVADVTTKACRFASGKGYLFVVNPDIEPLVISYDKVTDSITTTKIAVLARDFEGLRDGLQNDEEPSVLSKEHFYNLLNQGWVSTKTT